MQGRHIQTQTEWEEDMTVRILEQVRQELYLDLRFFDTALSGLKPVCQEGLEAMATDGEWLHVTPAQVIRVYRNNPLYMNRACLHTVLHCVFSHLWMRGRRQPRLWNAACDMAVEYAIDALGRQSVRRALSLIRQQTYEVFASFQEGISAAVVYRWLAGLTEEEQRVLAREFYVDDHRFWKTGGQSTQTDEDRERQKKWNRIARQMQLARDRKGDDPREGEKLLAAQLRAQRSRRDYRDFLRKFAALQEELRCDPEEFDLTYYTYGLKVYGNMPLIEPVESREVMRIREFVIVVDTSYSTSGELVRRFLRETLGILSQKDSFLSRSEIRVIQCDDQVRTDTVIQNEQDLHRFLRSFDQEFALVGGGGTDFRPAFAYVDELRKSGEMRDVAGLLYFTDGKGIYPARRPDYKCAFLFLTDYDDMTVPPWAMRFRLEPEELEDSKA
ncbi:MAG: metallopeptidase [Lachnospiraceae bacterium]|nr:metallopeptidase [Lachnospiraceae bacterium]